ncbi:MAG: signal peptidase I [Chloroflexi bacterium]|nr:signal peptidase I [Chloroflexota bacterium]
MNERDPESAPAHPAGPAAGDVDPWEPALPDTMADVEPRADPTVTTERNGLAAQDAVAGGGTERPLSLRSRARSTTVIDRGEQVYIDAWDTAAAETAPAPAKPAGRSTLLLVREVVETGILALAIFLAVRGVIQNFRVEGSSMDPTYASGQYVLVNKLLYARLNFAPLDKVLPFLDLDGASRQLFRGPKRGEVIVFQPPLPNSADRDFIKRVIGLPGERVQVRDGRVSINGRALEEPYLRNVQTFCGGQWCDVTLDSDQYFVMGDNRTNSSDSRLWGPIREDKVIGKAWFIYLPRDDFGPAPNQAPVLGDPASAGSGSERQVQPATTRP